MMYLVLGMHKSGTSLVSQILHRSGIHMGEGFDEGGTYDDGNQWERRDAFLINLALCRVREEDYFSLDHYSELREELPEAQEAAMRRMVERYGSSTSDWGFKEPLTCLTYELWKRVLPAHKVIAVYRSPVEVINHYRVPLRDPAQAWRVLRAWSNYNRGMMRAVTASAGDAILIRYEALMRDDREYSRLQEFIGRSLADVRDPSQHRAAARSFFYAPVDRLMGVFSSDRPSKVLENLETLRSQELDRSGGSSMQGLRS